MDISAVFDKQQQYFGKKYIFLSQYRFSVISFYCSIASQNCSSDGSVGVSVRSNYNPYLKKVYVFSKYGSLFLEIPYDFIPN